MNKFQGNKSLGIIIAVLVAIFLILKLTGSSAAGIFLFIGAIILAAFVILVLLITLFAIGKGKKDFENLPKNKAASDMPAEILEAKTSLLASGRLLRRIRRMNVKASAQKDFDLCSKIIDTISKQPEEVRRSTQFFTYYLPTYGTVLEKYLVLEDAGVDLDSAAEKAITCLANMQDALDKQYRNLFSNEMLDLTVEMNALDTIMKKDGFKS